ncbi:hypothetical protein B9Z19DRAFT_1120145 [Tuber borchii]|uniref:Uncharacterized protein n=1 Tax=Tuber borchii TaxID=42251 RepID=A0A2T7A4U4_TUBBO|nr:hypothetical protein B9Z19DRAFT_1120145 [Tuber borchii]
MPTPNGPLQEFFSRFNFQRYTYDPHKPPLEEFERLCQARQWGPSKIRKHKTAFLLIVEREQDLSRGLAAPNAPLQDFFSQFNFQRYTYDPHNPALEEFKRLCRERQWGPSKIREHETAFLLAVEREKDLGGSLAGPNAPLQEFFSQFNFREYTYDPHTPAPEEFKRLCEARRWGASKIREHETAFLLAVEREQDLRGGLTGPNVIEFFRKYEYQRFTYDLDAPIQSEFQRLVKLRGWGEVNLSKVTEQFNKAVALDARDKSGYAAPEPTDSEDLEEEEVDLLVDWMWKQECCEYSYRGALPEINFKKLKGWERVYGESEGEFESLHKGFNQVVEKVFDSLLDELCEITEITGIKPWQLLVGLYGQGQQDVEKQDAGIILKNIFVNIFDFLDAFQKIPSNLRTTDGQEFLRRLKPLAVELQFPNDMILGVYSFLTGRVYPAPRASKDGTLVLLLQRIKRYWEGSEAAARRFGMEAGDELQVAKQQGRLGIRRLLLSRPWECFNRR